MVANPKKFRLMFLGLKGQKLRLNINYNKLSATDYVKLLGIEGGNKLKFNKHVKTLCSKVTKKISAFSRFNAYISREQALTICNAVILSNFNYCPLIWLFCNNGANKEIDRTHKRALPSRGVGDSRGVLICKSASWEGALISFRRHTDTIFPNNCE